jgi:hypothetical protein
METNQNEKKAVGECYAAMMEINNKVKTYNRLHPDSLARVQLLNEISELQSKFDSFRKMVKDKESRSMLTFLNRTKNKIYTA